jgi:predicted negative regulator of RcsB-dependent stress response
VKPDALESAADRTAVATILATRGRDADARAALREAVSLLDSVLGPDHYEVVAPLDMLGDLASRSGDHREAAAAYDRALTIRRRVLGNAHQDVAVCRAKRDRARSSERR